MNIHFTKEKIPMAKEYMHKEFNKKMLSYQVYYFLELQNYNFAL